MQNETAMTLLCYVSKRMYASSCVGDSYVNMKTKLTNACKNVKVELQVTKLTYVKTMQ